MKIKLIDKGKRYDPFFKPEWSEIKFYGYNYLNHITCVSSKLFWNVNGLRMGYEGAQDYDFLLRATEKTQKIHHIQKILYHWRAIPGSTALKASEKSIVNTSATRILNEALLRRNIKAKLYKPVRLKSTGSPIHQLIDNSINKSVEIIIPTKDCLKVLKKCISSILNKTIYKNYHITIIDNESIEKETHKYLKKIQSNKISVLRVNNKENKFSFSYINNVAVKKTNSDYILFLNNDIEILDEEWLTKMLTYSTLNKVGVVGAKLLFPNRKIQHAGVILNMFDGFIPDHDMYNFDDETNGYYFNTISTREVSAVTGACMLIKRKLFNLVKGFDEEHFPVTMNDIDLCLKIKNEGFSIVCIEDTKILHHESYSRNRKENPIEISNFVKKYRLTKESFYSKSFSSNIQYQIDPNFSTDIKADSSKIGFYTHNLNYEGAPNVILNFAKEVKKLTNNIPIIIAGKDGPQRKELENLGLQVIIFESRNTYDASEEWFENEVTEIKTFLTSYSLNLLVVNVANCFQWIHSARNLKIPTIWWIHESYDDLVLRREFSTNYILNKFKETFSISNRVLFVSNDTYNIYNDYNQKNNYLVINNSINFDNSNIVDQNEFLKANKTKTKEKVLLTVGTVCDRKDQLTIVKACEQLLKKEMTSFYI